MLIVYLVNALIMIMMSDTLYTVGGASGANEKTPKARYNASNVHVVLKLQKSIIITYV